MTESDELTSRLAGLTVMVVEDETIVSFLVEDMLTELGCAQVLHASGVSEALTLLQQRQPASGAARAAEAAASDAYAYTARAAVLRMPATG